jgi:hypothetical protein
MIGRPVVLPGIAANSDRSRCWAECDVAVDRFGEPGFAVRPHALDVDGLVGKAVGVLVDGRTAWLGRVHPRHENGVGHGRADQLVTQKGLGELEQVAAREYAPPEGLPTWTRLALSASLA